jgi:hypothetical protein
MVSLGLLERQGDRYGNGEAAAAFLCGRPGSDLRPMLRFWDRISYPAWLKLEDAVRTGEGQAHFGRFSAEEQQIFSAGVQSFTAPVAAALAAGYDFGRHRRVLDVAGGTGSFLVAALRRHPALRGTLFELPGARVPRRANTLVVSPRRRGSRSSKAICSRIPCPTATTFCSWRIRCTSSRWSIISRCCASCARR